MDKPPADMTNAEMAATLMRQASRFFLSLGEQNPSVREQMTHNARTFEQVAELVETNPLGKTKTQPH